MIIQSFPETMRIIKITEQQYYDILHDTEYDANFNKIPNKEKLITERWSVSEEVDNAVEMIYNIIKNNMFKTKKGKQIFPNLYKNEDSADIVLFGHNIKLMYYIYNLTHDSAAFYIPKLNMINNFSETKQTLTISVLATNWNLAEDYTYTNISHELEHALQFYKNKNTNPEFKTLTDDAYKFSASIADSPNLNNCQKCLANIFYYSNYREQDAFVTEYYNEVKYNRDLLLNLRDSEIIHRFLYYKASIEYFQKKLSTTQMQNAIQQYERFGYNEKNIKLMIQKAYPRFMKKLNNIEKHFKNNFPSLEPLPSGKKIQSIRDRFSDKNES